VGEPLQIIVGIVIQVQSIAQRGTFSDKWDGTVHNKLASCPAIINTGVCALTQIVFIVTVHYFLNFDQK
jgi:hypothetical protein